MTALPARLIPVTVVRVVKTYPTTATATTVSGVQMIYAWPGLAASLRQMILTAAGINIVILPKVALPIPAQDKVPVAL